MYGFNNINLIYFIIILLTVYFTGKLAVKKILKNRSGEFRDIVRNAVIDGLSQTNEDNNKNN